jgi:hypothetical protein
MPSQQPHTLPKPHMPTLQPKLCQRVCLSSPRKTSPSKNLNSSTHPSTDKNKLTITAELKRHNYLTDKNRQCITGGIFYCRDSGYFSVSASNKLSCNLIGKCFEIGNKNIPPIRFIPLSVMRYFTEMITKSIVN